MKPRLLEQLPLPLDGPHILTREDHGRLARQRRNVWDYMTGAGVNWRLLSEISEVTGAPEASVSARLRDLRKRQYGGHTVERRKAAGFHGLFEYRVIPNLEASR